MSDSSDLPRFVELNRRFEKLEREESSEASALRSYTTASVSSLFGIQSGMGWPELLENRVVIILGEPGSGKTWEFRERVRLLNAAGKLAFFIQLDQLVTGSIPQIFDPQKALRFDKWLWSGEAAFFFLDSVDEAKFHMLADFYTALDRFVAAIGADGLARATTLISCRVSEWQPQSDADEVTRRLNSQPLAWFRRPRLSQKYQASAINLHKQANSTGPFQKIGNEGTPALLVVQLQPLDRRRVEAFVRAVGTTRKLLESLRHAVLLFVC